MPHRQYNQTNTSYKLDLGYLQVATVNITDLQGLHMPGMLRFTQLNPEKAATHAAP